MDEITLSKMKLLMISGDRSILRGKKGAFWYTLEEFHKEWDRIDIICPRVIQEMHPMEGTSRFGNVFFHPSPRGILFQKSWIQEKGMELLDEYHHDVITAHDYPPFFHGVGANHLSRRTGTPFAVEIHHIVGFPIAASLAEFFGRVQSRLYLPWICKKAAAIRVVNHSIQNILVSWKVPEKKIAVVPSSYLNHDLLLPNPTIQKTYDVACGGRLVANKGVADVIRAVSLTPGVSLVIFGEGPLRSSLERLSQSLNITNRVHFAGWAEEGVDVYRTLQSAKIFVMNSKSEGGPRIALEAMALGLPVISTRVGVMPDVIEDQKNGLFTTGEPKDLAAKIQMFLKDSSLRGRCGQEARKILDHFERKTLIKRYAEFLQSFAK